MGNLFLPKPIDNHYRGRKSALWFFWVVNFSYCNDSNIMPVIILFQSCCLSYSATKIVAFTLQSLHTYYRDL
jgi:hypothetical protein